ncbi:MAG: hypothetical protein CMN29_25205 [Sandaracinus sp.]|nr:hypothetical protein [Myxococcales bacterium]MAT28211.1 hypothetical protein [Sandaracinus sp.]
MVLLAFALAPRVEAQRPAAGFAAGDAAAAPRERVGAEAATPAPVDPRPSVGFFFATDYLAGVGPSGGDLSRGRVDLGLRIRPNMGYFAVDLALGLGGGRVQRPDLRDAWMEMGLRLDARLYANPWHRAQLFAVFGAGLGIGSSPDPDAAHVEMTTEECPSLSMFFVDASAGLGTEIGLGENAGLSLSARVVRRVGLAGDLAFAGDGRNPPGGASDRLLGVQVGATLAGYFDAVSRAEE